jgi:hypothetical protein
MTITPYLIELAPARGVQLRAGDHRPGAIATASVPDSAEALELAPN